MQEITINLDNTHSVGLGDNLCLLSALANLPVPVKLLVNNNHNTYDRLTQYARIFRIPKSQLDIQLSKENGNFNNVGWPVKLFTDYYKPLAVNVHGNVIKLSKGIKPCIALVTSFDKDPLGNNEWPWSRCRPLEYWGKIFEWLKSLNYEVITLDNPYHDLENKVEMLAKSCRAIISYEGGMAHLAHMMDLPCFLIDWKLPSPSTALSSFHCEFVHRTNSVYIVRHDEIFNWSRDQFDSQMYQLEHNKTNNRLVNGECRLEFTGIGCKGQVLVKDQNDNILLYSDPIFGDSKVAEVLNSFYFK